jgi:sugar O-acyltransferase (sialic acid O-acetyltransferase NeuD family)
MERGMNIIIVGAGGLGREVLEILERMNSHAVDILREPYATILGFLDDNPELRGRIINGYTVLGDTRATYLISKGNKYICAIGNNRVKKSVVERMNVNWAEAIVHPRATVGRHVRLDVGVIVNAGTVITTDVYVAKHSHIDIGCTVSHDVVVGEYCRVNPGVHLNGGVILEEGAYIGAGAVILPYVKVGEWATVGAGAVVTESVPKKTTVMGVPAKVVSR